MLSNRKLAELIAYTLRYNAYLGREMSEEERGLIRRNDPQSISVINYYLDKYRPEGNQDERDLRAAD